MPWCHQSPKSRLRYTKDSCRIQLSWATHHHNNHCTMNQKPIYTRPLFHKNIDKGIKIDHNVLGHFFLFTSVRLGVVGYSLVPDTWGTVYRCCVRLRGMPSPAKRDTPNDTAQWFWSTSGSKPLSFTDLEPHLSISLHHRHAL